MTSSTSNDRFGAVALFVPCYVDQFYPEVGVATVRVLERLGLRVIVPEGAVCCGQPNANAGYESLGERALERFVQSFGEYDRVIVPSGSCVTHIRAHAAHVGGLGQRVADRTVELCAFLHDEIGLDALTALDATYPHRVGVHIGCHALRGLGLARPSERQIPPFDKMRALLHTVRGLAVVDLARPDECCGFGGTFAVAEPAVSVWMGRDRLLDHRTHGAEAIVSTDLSCLMHLKGVAGRAGWSMPMLHVVQLWEAGGAA